MDFEPISQFVKTFLGKTSQEIGKMPSKEQAAFVRRLQRDVQQREILLTPLKKLEVVCFDFETTGFYPEKGDEIISIGAIRIKGDKIVQGERFYSLVRPKKIPGETVLHLTGLSVEGLKKAPALADVLFQFFRYVRYLPLVAHHASHEKKFLHHATRKAFRVLARNKIIDSSFLFRAVDPHVHLKSLDEWCEHTNICPINRHHALGDALLIAKLWCFYIHRAYKEGFENLQEVYEEIGRLNGKTSR